MGDDSSGNTVLLRNLTFSAKLRSPIGNSPLKNYPSRCQLSSGNSRTVVRFGSGKKIGKQLISIKSNANEELLEAVKDLDDVIEQCQLEKSTRRESAKKATARAVKKKNEKNCWNKEKEMLVEENEESEDEEKEHLLPEKFPPQMNILVLGETGVGKSTFINGLVNYLKYESLDDAMQAGPEILIKSSFTLTDDDFVSREIVTEPTQSDEQYSNEKHGKGQSATQEPKSYVFSWTNETERKSIRIIDTPGIGDTRGIDQDKKNFDKILSFIADYSEIHAICILVKPNTARLTLAFRFCIDELLVHLHKSASKNILFCFTNTRGTLYKPGDTLPTLREHLVKLEDARGISIPLDISTLFCFDNESFRFLCAAQDGIPFSESETDNFAASWSKSVDEAMRLFTRITQLPAHSVASTLCLNNTRSAILTLSRPLAEVARNQLINMRLIEDKMKEVEQHVQEGRVLRRNLEVDQVILTAEEIPYPQTVCTSDGCVDRQRVGTNPNAPMQIICKTICHAHCGLQGVQVENCPNTILQRCAAMGFGSGTANAICQGCGCSWAKHQHLRYKLKQTMVKVLDPTVQKSIKNKDDAVDTINIFLEKEREKVAELKRESDKISSYCVEFAAFLAQNSILPYNDSYKQYINHLIRQEHENVGAGGSSQLLTEMEKYKEEYEQQVIVLNARMGDANSRSVRSVEEMNKMVEELQNLRHCGSVLTEIRKLETMKVRQTQIYAGKVIDLSQKNSWFGGKGKREKQKKKNKKNKKKGGHGK